MAFIIKNKTTNTVGPYIGQNISSLGELTVNPPIADVAFDQAVIRDLSTDTISLVIDGLEYTTDKALYLLQQIAISAAQGKRTTPAPQYATMVGGKDIDGNLRSAIFDKQDAMTVNVEGQKRTYSASISSLVLAALATDFFTITGADGALIRIESISLTGESNANQVPEITLVKRSTANTGGTFTTVAAVPHDSADSPAVATIRAYTANPSTLGTLVGSIRSYDMFLSGGNANPPQILLMEFNEKNGKSPRLRSANEMLALNFAGVTITGANFAINITWTEE